VLNALNKRKEIIKMTYPKNYTADDFNRGAAAIPMKAEVEKKMNALADFGFITTKNEAAVRAWLSTFKTESAMTRALRPVVRWEKKIEEVMYAEAL
jgi:hypothetical protein